MEAAKRELPDLIIMDIRMPVMNGDEAVNKLSLDPLTRKIPVIFLTATLEKGEEASLKIDASRHSVMIKPTTKKELLAEVEKKLRARS